MAGILDFLFGGKYPSTSKYEKTTNHKTSEYKRFIEFAGSDIYKRNMELDELIHTGEFEKRVRTLKTEKFKDTEAFRKWQDYKTLLNNTEIKDYLKFIQTGKAAKLERILQSASYKEFQELSIWEATKEFENKRKEKDFKKSKEYSRFASYKKLKNFEDLLYIICKNIEQLQKIKKTSSLQLYIADYIIHEIFEFTLSLIKEKNPAISFTKKKELVSKIISVKERITPFNLYITSNRLKNTILRIPNFTAIFIILKIYSKLRRL